MTVRAAEFFCGIGGFSAAVAGWNVEVVGAYDQSPAALAVYRHNFPGKGARQEDLERILSRTITECAAGLWWLSPPCQPYSVRGRHRDLDDPRAKSLLRILDLFADLPSGRLPHYLALENVAGFHHSLAHTRLRSLLAVRGYRFHETLLCPTELGIPSRRRRYYLVASRTGLNPLEPAPVTRRPLIDYLDPHLTDDCPAELLVDDKTLSRFGSGFRILDPGDPRAYTTCFTAGYGKSLMHAGSYLRCTNGVRRFAPEEIARLLLFPDEFRFPDGIPLRKRWHLIGNSLSVAAVRYVLCALPGLMPPDAPRNG